MLHEQYQLDLFTYQGCFLPGERLIGRVVEVNTVEETLPDASCVGEPLQA